MIISIGLTGIMIWRAAFNSLFCEMIPNPSIRNSSKNKPDYYRILVIFLGLGMIIAGICSMIMNLANGGWAMAGAGVVVWLGASLLLVAASAD
jgi:hypothetical protein